MGSKRVKDCHTGIVKYLQCAVSTGEEKLVAGPRERYVICLDRLLVLRKFSVCKAGYAKDGIVLSREAAISMTITVERRKHWLHTFVPTTNSVPSGLQQSEKHSLPVLISATLALLRTSQIRTVPSRLQLASSASRIGLNATRSTLPV